MNNFEAMNNFGSLEDGAAAARSKTALENSFDNNAALFDKDETVRVSGVSAQNSLETDAGYRPEKKAPSHSSPPPSRASLSPVPLSQQANSFSTESAQQQQPNLSASSAVLTPPNTPQSSPTHHHTSQNTPSQSTPSQDTAASQVLQTPLSLQPPAAAGTEEDSHPPDSSHLSQTPPTAAPLTDHMNTFPPATAAAAAVEEDGVCSWDMVDAIREEDDGWKCSVMVCSVMCDDE